MEQTYSQSEVAEILDLSVDSLKKWRSRAYADHPQRLTPSITAEGKSSRYTAADLREWLERNPAKRRELVGLVVEPMLPLARAVATADELRGMTAAPPHLSNNWNAALVHVESEGGHLD